MADEFDRDYFGYRAEEERALSAAAADPRAATVHDQLAERYALLASEFPETRPTLHIVTG